MQSFSQLGVSARIAQTLAARDIHEPFPIQARVLPDALAGRDVLAKSPTGSGKTLSFAIPILERLEPGERKPWHSSALASGSAHGSLPPGCSYACPECAGR